MTRKEKELLARDLSGRLDYEPYIKIEGCTNGCTSVFLTGIYYDYEDYGAKNYYVNNGYDISRVKPYLFPLSSMTLEQSKIYHELIGGMFETSALINFEVLEDFFHKNHFDYRGLIPMGLAIDATNLNIYYQ